MSLCLEIFYDGLPIRSLELEQKTYVLGCDKTCDVPLDTPGLLPKLLQVLLAGDKIAFKPLINNLQMSIGGRPVRSGLLPKNAKLEIGKLELLLSDNTEKHLYSEQSLRVRLHDVLLQKLDLGKINIDQLSQEELWARCQNIIRDIIATSQLPSHIDPIKMETDVLREALSLGPLEELLADESVSEIMVNGRDNLFVERHGKIEKVHQYFTSDAQIVHIIGRIVHPIGRRIDESVPMVDARLPDGSRVNAIIPPLALRGPSITIRKFSKNKLTTDNLLGFGTLDKRMALFLKLAVELKQNIIISGGTGSGKTTLLNVLANFIPSAERVVTVEDSAELRLPQENLVALEARTANVEGKGAVAIRDLVKNALRMRPDRIVVGECRSGETLDMLQAMNTGHDGSLTTLHANSAEDAILRLETMVMMAGFDLPVSVIRRQIASAIQIIIQQSRLTDGTRKIVSISEIVGINGLDVIIRPIFQFKKAGLGKDNKLIGKFVACGHTPRFVQEAIESGILIETAVFKADSEDSN